MLSEPTCVVLPFSIHAIPHNAGAKHPMTQPTTAPSSYAPFHTAITVLPIVSMRRQVTPIVSSLVALLVFVTIASPIT